MMVERDQVDGFKAVGIEDAKQWLQTKLEALR
jgi:hypothetical protein